MTSEQKTTDQSTAKTVPEPKPVAKEAKAGGEPAQAAATTTSSATTGAAIKPSGQPANGTLVRDIIDHLKVLKFQEGTDRICIVTKLPDSVRQKFGTLTLEFRAAHHGGEEYCKRYFPGIRVEVQEMK